MTPCLKIEHISKEFNGKAALRDVSLSISRGEIFSLLGPSGSGKTTLLKIIAGLETTDRGKIIFNNTDITRTPPHRRGFGMMFQEFALFPHRNVHDNISFGLEIKRREPERIRLRVQEILEIVGLEGFAHRRVNELSGGERQRVALARSLAPSPGLLMLDEPLGSLDRALREKLLSDLVEILKKLQMTTIFVTHDQMEAFAASDTVAVMKNGRLEQLSAPEELYNNPVNMNVAHFLGFRNILGAEIYPGGKVRLDCGFMFRADPVSVKSGRINILIRPDRAFIIGEKGRAPEDTMVIHGKIHSRIFQGRSYNIGVMIESGEVLFFDIPNLTPPPERGTNICLGINIKDGMVYL